MDDRGRQSDYSGAFDQGALKVEADGPGGVRLKMTFTPLEGGRVRQLLEVLKDGAPAGPSFDGIYSHP